MLKKMVWNFLLAGSLLSFVEPEPVLAYGKREVTFRYCAALSRSANLCLAVPKNATRNRGYLVFTGFMYRKSGPVFIPAVISTKQTAMGEIQTWVGFHVKKNISARSEEFLETEHTIELSVPQFVTGGTKLNGKYKNSDSTYPLSLELSTDTKTYL